MATFDQAVFDSAYPLHGATLVEAAAGTGKTYQIQNAYLRLVLAEGVPVENILVVTFTDAATRELRTRLRGILVKCNAFLAGHVPPGDPDDARLRAAADLPLTPSDNRDGDAAAPGAREDNAREQRIRVRTALMDFDHAAIFTIHGFCRRVLERYAFECGHDPDAELLPDDSEVIRDICRNWWRRQTYGAGPEATAVPFQGPDELRAYVTEALERPDAEIKPERPSPAETARIQDALCTEAKILWQGLAACRRYGAVEPQAEARTVEAFLRPIAEARTKTPNGKNAAVDGKAGFPEAIPRVCQEKEEADRMGSARRMLNIEHRTLNIEHRKGALTSWAAGEAGLAGFLAAADKARWSSALAFPEGPARVIRAAGTRFEGAAIRIAKNTDWASSTGIRLGANKVLDVSDVLQTAAETRDAVETWLRDLPAFAWKTTQKATAAREAFLTLAREAADPAQRGDAAAFLRHVKTLAGLTADDVFERTLRFSKMRTPETDWMEQAQRLLLAQKADIVSDVAARVRSDTRRRRVLTYRDMLLNVRDALGDAEAGSALCTALREEFRAALIDEFQDTDPVQYGIFDRLFAGTGAPLLFVGDPKQAIYGFRGGDIHAYHTAKQAVRADRRLSLTRNYRSTSNMVAAVNELFAEQSESRAFLHDRIDYTEIAAGGVPDEKRLLIDGREPERPLRIWNYTPDKMPSATSDVARHIYEKTAEEVARLLASPTVTRGGRPLGPSDIAVLTATHDEVEYVYQALRKRRVNAVRQRAGNVFDTEDAQAVAHLMRALLAPGDAACVRTALSLDVLPCTEAQLRTFRPEPDAPDTPADPAPAGRSLEDWMDIFGEAGRLWMRRSFIESVACLESALNWRAHVLELEDGPRRLTNLLHTVDLAHQAARSRALGPDALLRWLILQLDPASRTEEEDSEIRISSDRAAVQVMTVYKSKGLEFPIVFLPTLWRKSADPPGGTKSRMLAYHQPDGPMVLNLDRSDEAGRERQRREALEETVRLIYVAVTRAANLAYMVTVTPSGSDAAEPEKTHALRHLYQRLPTPTRHVDIHACSADTPDPARPTLLDERAGLPRVEDLVEPPPAQVDKTHGHTSFSALIESASEPGPGEGRDIDADDEAEPEPAAPAPLFRIPGGAQTGHCWHDILETIDFMADAGTIRRTVDAALDRTGICRDPVPDIEAAQREAVHDMIRNVLRVPLTAGAASFRLDSIPRAARRSELRFDLALQQQGEFVRLSDIRDVLRNDWDTPARDETFLDTLAGRDTRLPRGFLTGFMDLVFLHGNRFYIVDWKSNRLDGELRHFEPSGLRREMTRHGYYLQYMLYAVALDAFLRRTLRGYTFETHFGGVFYIFLRGIDGLNPRGLFHDPLSESLVSTLSSLLCVSVE